jgi:hypothetical protein
MSVAGSICSTLILWPFADYIVCDDTYQQWLIPSTSRFNKVIHSKWVSGHRPLIILVRCTNVFLTVSRMPTCEASRHTKWQLGKQYSRQTVKNYLFSPQPVILTVTLSHMKGNVINRNGATGSVWAPYPLKYHLEWTLVFSHGKILFLAFGFIFYLLICHLTIY